MIRNYLTIAWRILMRQKTYSAVNIFGLTTGVAASLLIVLYVAHELSYDRFVPGGDRIYRVNVHGKILNDNINVASVGFPLAEAIQTEVAGIESVTRFDKWGTCPVRFEERTFTERSFCLADSNFFSFFGYDLVAGDPNTALMGPGKIVISESAAVRYFDYKGKGDRSPLGKTMVVGSEGTIFTEVTGIVADAPDNTHMHFDFLMSLPTADFGQTQIWLNFEVFTYLKVLPGVDIGSVQHTMDGFVPKYCGREVQQFLKISYEQFVKQGGKLAFSLQPLYDIHLTSHFQDELEPNGNISYVYLFTAIALFIVILACINFMNLSTARSANRAKEIGVRKTVGALRYKLMGQFFTESFMYGLIAFLFAYGIVHVLINPFNALSGKSLSPDILYHPVILIAFVLLMIFIGLLSGSYPALYLTSFKPVEVLKGNLRAGNKNATVRNSLVVFQFVVSISLIIASLTVYRQMRFLQDQDVGFEKENVVGLMHTMNLGPNSNAFKEELLRHPEFVAASYSSRTPPDVDWGASIKTESGPEEIPMAMTLVDHDHLDALGLTLVQGRFFSREFRSDSSAAVINETAAKQLGYHNIEGKFIRFAGGNDDHKIKVIGVVKDYNFESLKSTIRPMVLLLSQPPNWGIVVRFSKGNQTDQLRLLEKIWKQFAPNSPFEYAFIDENFDAKFRAEQRLGNVILVFTTLAIFIACLGLFGLATFTAEQRSKEISIRKILGANVSQLVVLLSRDFVKLILLSLLIAIPITWYGVNQWLEGFAYRVNFSFVLVFVAGMTALLIALFTVSFQSIRAALGNPVDSLKSE